MRRQATDLGTIGRMANPLLVVRALRPVFDPVIRPVLRPVTRTAAGWVAVPTFRFVVRRVLRLGELDAETEKDLIEWFRASVVLLLATRNVEAMVFSDVPVVTGEGLDWLIMGGRLLLAVAVIETMPDQQLFAIIHPGPPPLKYDRALGLWGSVRKQWRPVLRGLACQHLNRSSPVLAIMAAVFGGVVGWVCYALAITQYLIIGLVTSVDRAADVLSQFDSVVARKRREIIEEFSILPEDTRAPLDPPAAPVGGVHLR